MGVLVAVFCFKKFSEIVQFIYYNEVIKILRKFFHSLIKANNVEAIKTDSICLQNKSK